MQVGNTRPDMPAVITALHARVPIYGIWWLHGGATVQLLWDSGPYSL